ncbi:pectate lyase-like adhesive domain-containing protein, partial [Lactobacillus johnsonii]
MKDRKFKKNQKSKSKYIDPNSLKETEDSSKPYLKELAALAAILGTGATGAAILPNDRVYAAQTSVDAKSQIVGSVSESTQTDLSKQGHSKSDENGVRASNSEAKSMSSSSSKSLLISKSTSISLSQSISHSQSTSRSVSLSNSQSQSESLSYSKSKLTSLSVAEKRTSTSHRDKSSNSSKTKDKSSVSNSNNNANASNSTYVGNFYSSENSSIIEKQSTDQSNLNDTTSLSLSNTQLIDRSLKIPVALQTSINKISTDNKEQLNKKQQLNELSLNGIFTNLVQTNTGVDVSNAQEFYNAVANGTNNNINVTSDIDLGAYTSSSFSMSNPRNLTINGNGHTINFGYSYIIPNWSSSSQELTVTINDAKLYTANSMGAVVLNHYGLLHIYNNKLRLIYNNVNAIGGTAVFADTTSLDIGNGVFNNNTGKPSKTFEIKGNTSIKAVNSYTYNGTIYIPAYSDIHSTALISPAFNVVIDNGANVVLDAGGSAEYNIQLQGNWGTHTISIGDNAHVEMRGATRSNVYMLSYAIGDNVINVGNNAYVDMTVPDSATDNIDLTDNIDFNYDNTSVNNTVNINPGAFVSLNGPSNFSSNRTVTININDPSLVFLKNSGGKAYAGNATYTINAQNTSIKTVDGDIITATPVLKSNTATIKGTNVQSSNTVFLPNEEGTAKQVKEINRNIVKRRITEYQGYTANSESVSMSESLSNSVSMSESLSNSVSMSESLSNSVSMSDSLSNSVSMSESLSNSVSMSESLSNSVSMSESLSNSVSMSESLSNSVSMSESLSNSVSMSDSLSNSVSMSESLSNSVSMSESLSNSVSMSESLSNSVSMSESLSNSVSMSESL